MIELVGYAAAAMTTCSFLPQVVKVWRTRSAGDISLGMYALLSLGVACWVAYGLLIRSLPVILANGATLLLALAVLAAKLRFGARRRP
jgi:MtN3 and saliva related transmembrane protein